MKSGIRPRHLALGGAFLAAVVAAASLAIGAAEDSSGAPAAGSPDGTASGSRRPADRAADTRLAAEPNWADKLRRPPIEINNGGTPLFGSKNWTPPPPPTAAKTAPTVPPFPFHYLGKIVLDGGATTLYLGKGDEVYTVKPGDVIEGHYRVDQVGADYLEVTYLPLGRKQNMTYSSITPPVRADAAMTGRTSAPVALAQVVGAAPAYPPAITASGDASNAGGTPSPAKQAGTPAGPGITATTPPAAAVGARPLAAGVGAPAGTPAGGGMVISPPTISQMPMSPPTISEMPILPPPSGTMPMSAPTISQMPMTPAGGTLTTSPPPNR